MQEYVYAKLLLLLMIAMKATIPYIERKFDEFNRQMFGGKHTCAKQVVLVSLSIGYYIAKTIFESPKQVVLLYATPSRKDNS